MLQIVLVNQEESTLSTILNLQLLKLVNHVTTDVLLVPLLELTVTNVPEIESVHLLVDVQMNTMMMVPTLPVQLVDVTVYIVKDLLITVLFVEKEELDYQIVSVLTVLLISKLLTENHVLSVTIVLQNVMDVIPVLLLIVLPVNLHSLIGIQVPLLLIVDVHLTNMSDLTVLIVLNVIGNVLNVLELLMVVLHVEVTELTDLTLKVSKPPVFVHTDIMKPVLKTVNHVLINVKLVTLLLLLVLNVMLTLTELPQLLVIVVTVIMKLVHKFLFVDNVMITVTLVSLLLLTVLPVTEIGSLTELMSVLNHIQLFTPLLLKISQSVLPKLLFVAATV